MSKVFHLVYISKAAEDLSYTDIREILESSRRNNARLGLTGLLIFRDGYFLQLLEGQELAVRGVLERICEDDRNYSVKVLIETQSNKRLFEDWSMAFHDGDIATNSSEQLEKLFTIIRDGNGKKQDLILTLLRDFSASAPVLK